MTNETNEDGNGADQHVDGYDWAESVDFRNSVQKLSKRGDRPKSLATVNYPSRTRDVIVSFLFFMRLHRKRRGGVWSRSIAADCITFDVEIMKSIRHVAVTTARAAFQQAESRNGCTEFITEFFLFSPPDHFRTFVTRLVIWVSWKEFGH